MDLYEEWQDWLCDRWDGDFRHRYAITNTRHWKWYRDTFPSSEWTCDNLKQAKERYCWNGENYEVNSKKLDQLSWDLVASMQSSPEKTYECCEKIADWGGVPLKGATQNWLTKCCKLETIGSSIQLGVDALKIGMSDLQALQIFGRERLPMNSTTTKIFSLADASQKIVIYDGRVGAALCFLATRFLETKGFPTLPPSFKFRWGKNRRKQVPGEANLRDARTDNYRFSGLWGKNSDQSHAELVSKTSSLLGTVSKRTSSTPRDWEAALFMVGYSLRN